MKTLHLTAVAALFAFISATAQAQYGGVISGGSTLPPKFPAGGPTGGPSGAPGSTITGATISTSSDSFFSRSLRALFEIESVRLSRYTVITQARLASPPDRSSPLYGVLNAGDAIRRINGLPVASRADVEGATGFVELEYVDAATGMTRKQPVRLGGGATFRREYTVVAIENLSDFTLDLHIRWDSGSSKRLSIPAGSTIVVSEEGLGHRPQIAFNKDVTGYSRDISIVPLTGTDVSLTRSPDASDAAKPAGLYVFRGRVGVAN